MIRAVLKEAQGDLYAAGVFDWAQLIKDKKYDKYDSPTYGRMMRKLVRWARDPQAAHLSLAVNVSARQFRQPGFVAEVLQTLQDSGLCLKAFCKGNRTCAEPHKGEQHNPMAQGPPDVDTNEPEVEVKSEPKRHGRSRKDPIDLPPDAA